MQKVISNYKPRNEITTPLSGEVCSKSSGIIKAVYGKQKISIARIDYEEYNEEEFQYVISPFWNIIDTLTPSQFQGIPGIKMDLRLAHYYRVNYHPVFITERTPSESREDLWELLESVNLDYYDRFEWLLRTDLRCGNDNLIVERARDKSKTFIWSKNFDYSILQYGDTLTLNSMSELGNSASEYSDTLLTLLYIGVKVQIGNDEVIKLQELSSIITVLATQKELQKQFSAKRQLDGVKKAKSNGKYVGRKPIAVDESLMYETISMLDEKVIDVPTAMKQLNLTSRSTFYRKLNDYRNNGVL